MARKAARVSDWIKLKVDFVLEMRPIVPTSMPVDHRADGQREGMIVGTV